MELNDYCYEAHKTAMEHGFWDDYVFSDENQWIVMQLMLINSELVEAMNELRNGSSVECFNEELADVAIRLFDLCGGLGIDLEYVVKNKMNKNKTRPFKHNKKF